MNHSFDLTCFFNRVAAKTDLGSGSRSFWLQLCLFVTLWPWVTYLSSLSLNGLLQKMGLWWFLVVELLWGVNVICIKCWLCEIYYTIRRREQGSEFFVRATLLRRPSGDGPLLCSESWVMTLLTRPRAVVTTPWWTPGPRTDLICMSLLFLLLATPLYSLCRRLLQEAALPPALLAPTLSPLSNLTGLNTPPPPLWWEGPGQSQSGHDHQCRTKAVRSHCWWYPLERRRKSSKNQIQVFTFSNKL